MQFFSILAPVFVLVLLTFGIGIWLSVLRFAAVRRGDLEPGYYALNRGAEMPEYLAKVSQNYDNLLELPVLFYVICLFLYSTMQVEIIQVILAWLFVISRLVHSYIHTTYNNVLHRGYIFLAGAMFVFAMWLLFIWRVLQIWIIR